MGACFLFRVDGKTWRHISSFHNDLVVLGNQAQGPWSHEPQDSCACCTHTEQVDVDPVPIGECSDHESIKTRFSVRNLCCDSEVRLIERIVTQLPGVESVSINTFQKICIMVHCPRCSTPDSVMTKLNRAGLGAALLGQGNLEIHPVTPTLRDMVLSHSRHLIVEISALLMFLGVLCSNVPITGDSFLLLALLLGLCSILPQSLISLQKSEIDISTLVILAALVAAFEGERADAALVVFLFNLSKAPSFTRNTLSRSYTLFFLVLR